MTPPPIATTDPGVVVGAGSQPRASRRRWRNRRPWRRQGSGWRELLWRPTPMSVLIEEADRLADQHRWKDATRILSVAATTVEDDRDRRPVLERLAVTAADGGRHDVSREAVYELQLSEQREASTWVAFANVALARGNHLHADRAARSALEIAPDQHQAWAALAAGYAGLGWFDEAENCLDHLDRVALTERERWRIGRAVNRWSLAGPSWLIAGLLAFVFVGWLAPAIGAVAPLAVREWRLRRLHRAPSGEALSEMAVEAWRSSRRLRLSLGIAVWGSVGIWLAAALIP